MVLAFKERFVTPILEKKKIHTIREDKHSRWKCGRKIHMATGVRTAKYHQFGEGVCVSIQQFELIRKSDYMNESVVKVDGRTLSESEIQELAWNDGFNNLVDFWLWFSDGFEGKIIHWTDFKY